MDAAIEEAMKAGARGEVPVGAVIVMGGRIIARAHNSVIEFHDPSAHAEILAMREAGRKTKNYRLTGAELYVTIEPCVMCAGAMLQARIRRVVFGARDTRAGAVSLFGVFGDRRLNHAVEVLSGVREREAARVLQEFFRERRGR